MSHRVMTIYLQEIAVATAFPKPLLTQVVSSILRYTGYTVTLVAPVTPDTAVTLLTPLHRYTVTQVTPLNWLHRYTSYTGYTVTPVTPFQHIRVSAHQRISRLSAYQRKSVSA